MGADYKDRFVEALLFFANLRKSVSSAFIRVLFFRDGFSFIFWD